MVDAPMKEKDIRPTDVLLEYLRLSALDAKHYFDPARRVAVPCPACGSDDPQYAFEKHGFAYDVCGACGTLYLSPRPPLEEFEAFYNDSPSSLYWANTFSPAVAEVRREKIFVPRVEKISGMCNSRHFFPKMVMDVGAGYGIFLEEWKKVHSGSSVCAVEPGAELAETCREKGIEVLKCFAEHADAWAGRADLLTCFEVIEHAHNPLMFIQALYRLLQSGGQILISGLCVDGFDIQTLWEESNSISPPHHINFMSVRGFEILFKRAGFSEVRIMTPGKLDVDIIKNTFDQNPALAEKNRFANLLIARGGDARESFQRFLQEHLLSSHCWVFAKKA